MKSVRALILLQIALSFFLCSLRVLNLNATHTTRKCLLECEEEANRRSSHMRALCVPLPNDSSVKNFLREFPQPWISGSLKFVYLVVNLAQRRGHLVGEGACHNHHIRLPWAGTEDNAETIQVIPAQSHLDSTQLLHLKEHR